MNLQFAIESLGLGAMKFLYAIFAFLGGASVLFGEETTNREFPAERPRGVEFERVAKLELFPEGPSYRPSDGSYFFSGNLALTRVDPAGKTHVVLEKPGGGGTVFLPDGSVLIIGHMGLRRVFPDGRIALLADGNEIGAGNDLSIGKFGEVYFSVPKEGIYRLTPGENGKLEKVVDQGCNGLDVDPSGEFLYAVRKEVHRYRINGVSDPLGKKEIVFEFTEGPGGGDGCAFDAWGNLYTMHFATGVIRVVDPVGKKSLGRIPTGVVPSSNLTFGGPSKTELFVTAGAPKFENCQVLKTDLGIEGFAGHEGAVEYPMLRFLEERADVSAFAARP